MELAAAPSPGPMIVHKKPSANSMLSSPALSATNLAGAKYEHSLSLPSTAAARLLGAGPQSGSASVTAGGSPPAASSSVEFSVEAHEASSRPVTRNPAAPAVPRIYRRRVAMSFVAVVLRIIDPLHPVESRGIVPGRRRCSPKPVPRFARWTAFRQPTHLRALRESTGGTAGPFRDRRSTPVRLGLHTPGR